MDNEEPGVMWCDKVDGLQFFVVADEALASPGGGAVSVFVKRIKSNSFVQRM
ncbi:hypothetical protein NC652_024254 [Populus alba x Populus x berolinensis]|nr:hypothetical protein NC652_024254 [Populus alba x Populus x berolinensis]